MFYSSVGIGSQLLMEEKTLLMEEKEGEEVVVERDTDAIILADNENESTPNSCAEEDVGVTAGKEVGPCASPLEAANFQRSPNNFFLELGKKWMVKETIMLLKLALPLVSWVM